MIISSPITDKRNASRVSEKLVSSLSKRYSFAPAVHNAVTNLSNLSTLILPLFF
jgi:hypothetical protein